MDYHALVLTGGDGTSTQTIPRERVDIYGDHLLCAGAPAWCGNELLPALTDGWVVRECKSFAGADGQQELLPALTGGVVRECSISLEFGRI
ncbi:hypothetical protein CYMTET_6376 [Cymbomonas tetramitiformis]|uniref:Uncharacterized protein n=1 Tax=Cymbomonas tetramitiformis TaxID=36881 RepID=A0AAE0GXK6_9CHLO|nr:hypothetical protein CYMTET_6376 [Cymbomonas tetramitiformis]